MCHMIRSMDHVLVVLQFGQVVFATEPLGLPKAKSGRCSRAKSTALGAFLANYWMTFLQIVLF
ncbi:hypothetical protein BDV38DRAFT_256949 [Aspergillus pseudotamarii]|uniref:Uncharacterized protein n=1 Tax=Aspergillus pseudotamarii TaxID=132259 RepID=A0A5N6SH44_ASPPS|nr:uncharacterized protein BDV38DRAFT_256949 [Aspergillus pseudotamarii]KAE8133992.1 hypothetical protein BDV38DRAFT_256949 [Aspergillus pseudotamarii]